MQKGKTSRPARASVKPKSELLYQRGDYKLWSVPGRNHEIRIYNPATKQNDRTLTGTKDLEEAKKKLDKLYLGEGCCPRCGQSMVKTEAEGGDLIVNIIRDYLVAHGDEQISNQAIEDRLEHIKTYIAEKYGATPVRVGNVNEQWIESFRKWMKVKGYRAGKDQFRKAYKNGTVENSVIQLKAAIRKMGYTPLFNPKATTAVNGKVDWRADIPLMAAMFRYCLYPDASTEKMRVRLIGQRVNLLSYLRLAVATWGRPEAILEASLAPERKQWVSEAKVFRLQPQDGSREQNKKYRAEVPVGPWVAAWLDSLPAGPILTRELSKSTWARMMNKLKPGLPEREGGMKCIRRAMAKHGKKALGRTNWIQGKFMGGWEQPNSIADGYAGDDLFTLHDEEMMGRALEVTEQIIAEIEALCPGAFNIAQRIYSASGTNIVSMVA